MNEVPEYEYILGTITDALSDGPLESIPWKRLMTLVDDALLAAAIPSLLDALRTHEARLKEANRRAEEYRNRAMAAPDDSHCTRCMRTEDLIKSTVTCQKCYVELLGRTI